MLIFMQREKESAVITTPDGTEIYVTVVTIDRSRVRIGYAAPRSFTIDREVVHQRKKAEKAGEEPKDG